MGRPSGSDMDEKPRALTQYDGQTDRHVPNDPELTPEQIESDEDALQASLSGLAGMVGARGGNDLLTEVAEYAAQAIPGAEGLGVTVIQHSDGDVQIQAWEVTAAFVREIDILQYEVFSEGALHHEHSDSASGRKRVFWARIVVGLVSAP